MFSELQMAPPDPIMGLTEAFKADPNPEKINLGAGVFKDESGNTPIMSCVKKAEKILEETETTKTYVGIAGSPEYNAAVLRLMFGADHQLATSGRAAAIQAPGGTGALRVAGDFLKHIRPDAKIWFSDPTWANHKGVFSAAGIEIVAHPYYDYDGHSLNFNGMLEALKTIPQGDILLLHGCCHNPTGQDPSPEQWEQIAGVIAERGILPLIDIAYQGLAEGLEQDTVGLRAVCEAVPEAVIASSFSKNFGLYCERVGAMTLVAETAEAAKKAMSHIKVIVRQNYSNPPSHGAAIVTTVLNDENLSQEWEGEVAGIRDRINDMRRLFVDTLKASGVERDFSFITRQRGMFSFSGLTKDQVQTLKEKYSIYIVNSGRINVAALTPGNMDRLCGAIAEVL